MWHPDMAEATVAAVRAERGRQAAARRLVKLARRSAPAVDSEMRPAWLARLGACVEEPVPAPSADLSGSPAQATPAAHDAGTAPATSPAGAR